MSLLRRKIERVSVLGAGPAGLLAAYAAARAGYAIAVFSAPTRHSDGKVAKSTLFGCQYLHKPIPGLMEQMGQRVDYRLYGSSEGYRTKVYGSNWSGTVSPDEYGPEESHLAWDLRSAYESLWKWATDLNILVSCRLTAENVQALYSDRQAVVISTIPAPELCCNRDEHKFPTQDIWAIGGTSKHSISLPYAPPDFTVECNGHDAPRWYRAATVFGYSTLEWPAGVRPPVAGVAPVRKPLRTDCDCYLSKRSWRAGRYGTWTKGVLVHTAYYETLEKLGDFR